jgi:hypothetical protein
MDNTRFDKFLNNFLNFILLGKGMKIRAEHWEEDFLGLEEWNDHEYHGKGEFHGEWKK